MLSNLILFQASDAFFLNMDRVPILTYNESFQLGHSKAIERFVAKKLGLFGASDLEEAKIDMITEHVRDIKDKYNSAKLGKKDDDLAAAKVNFLANELPNWMKKLEKCLDSDGFAVGSRISLADVYLHQLILDYFDDLEAASRAVEECPKIKASANKVAEAAKVYFDTRPVTKF